MKSKELSDGAFAGSGSSGSFVGGPIALDALTGGNSASAPNRSSSLGISQQSDFDFVGVGSHAMSNYLQSLAPHYWRSFKHLGRVPTELDNMHLKDIHETFLLLCAGPCEDAQGKEIKPSHS